ncbi:MAG TPA: FxLYD domain-containing protein [Thermoanaerobaculia bacterium]|nr:FxLYD domain-containing protein [Thermoanaerobaculia bacterium]
MTTRARVLAAMFAAAVAATVPAALHADWIVTRQGDRFEIKGAWQLKGKLVVFTLPNGALSSMRADRVDLDASKQATEKAKQEAAAPPPAPDQPKAKRKAVIVLTDKDFKKTPLPDGAAEPGAAGGTGTNPADPKKGGKDAPPAKDVPSSVEVVTWDRVPASESKADGAEITGSVRNTSQSYLTEIGVVADLFDDNGGLIGRYPAAVDTLPLPPGESSKFHLVVNGVFAFASIRWETTAKGLKTQPPPATPPGPAS